MENRSHVARPRIMRDRVSHMWYYAVLWLPPQEGSSTTNKQTDSPFAVRQQSVETAMSPGSQALWPQKLATTFRHSHSKRTVIALNHVQLYIHADTNFEPSTNKNTHPTSKIFYDDLPVRSVRIYARTVTNKYTQINLKNYMGARTFRVFRRRQQVRMEAVGRSAPAERQRKWHIKGNRKFCDENSTWLLCPAWQEGDSESLSMPSLHAALAFPSFSTGLDMRDGEHLRIHTHSQIVWLQNWPRFFTRHVAAPSGRNGRAHSIGFALLKYTT